MTQEMKIKLALDEYYEARKNLENAVSETFRTYYIFDDEYFNARADLVEAENKLANRFIELISK